MTSATFKKFALFAAKASITVFLIWLVVRNIDLADTVQRVRSIPLWVVPVTLGLIFFQFAMGIWRWSGRARFQLRPPIPGATD